jgi:hypothetical protein
MNLTSLLWIGPPLVLQALLLRILLKTHKLKVFPCFFAYTGFSVLADLARLAVYNTDRLYFYVYWTSEVGYAVLGIAVMYEVYRTVFPGFRTFWWFRPIFPVIVLSTTVITIIHMMGLPAGLHQPFMSWIVAGELWVRILQVTIFVVLGILVTFFGLRWRQHPFGIAAGFGLYATVALLGTEKYSEFGTRFAWAWSVLSVVAYSMAALIWFWFFSGAPPQENHPSGGPPFPINDLESYNEFLRRKKGQRC